MHVTRHEPLLLLTLVVTGEKTNVIIADDDNDCVDILSEAILDVSSDSMITVASNGEKLMHLLNQRSESSLDVIFLDLDMPRKNGLECLEEIRRGKRWLNVPVVIHSTTANGSEIEEALRNGADLYLPKTGSFAELKELLKQGFQRAWGKTELHQAKNFI
jgi:DNA-binding NarL/FixJ family response regulator